MYVELPSERNAWCEECQRRRLLFPQKRCPSVSRTVSRSSSGSLCSTASSSAPGSPTGSVGSFLSDSVIDTMLTTRRPVWDEKLKGLTLDYGGHCKKASVRNFQLTSDPDGCCMASQAVLKFGKVDSDLFRLDYTGALNPVQAFALALLSALWK